jgi:ectoine hydroxylase-related dioxygenase (phytanoyl-CoA dioxygenase family)
MSEAQTGLDATALVSEADVAAFQSDGAVVLRGIFRDWVNVIAQGIAANEATPGPYGKNSAQPYDPGRFFQDYCNWQRIPEFRDFVLHSPAAAIAARVTGSEQVQFYHEHVLVKDAGTHTATPWHHDLPYYNVSGHRTVSMWISPDTVPCAAGMEFVAGSHRWGQMFAPRRFKDDADFDYGDDFTPMPDVEAMRDELRILSWDVEPGDALLFSFLTVHGARPNLTTGGRRAFSARWIGDDVRFCERRGKTSPPFPDIGLADGAAMREDWFPTLWPPAARRDGAT